MAGKKAINVEIGMNIKQERERAGLTQERLSELMGIGVKSLSAIERGTVGISLSALKRLCGILSVSSDALIFGSIETNDTAGLLARLERLTPAQFSLVCSAVNTTIEAFALGAPETGSRRATASGNGPV